MVEGKSNSEIAAILGLSPRTVGNHLARIYDCLGVETRTAAGRIALTTRRGRRRGTRPVHTGFRK